jgi:catalase (peroxidase I)
MGRGFLEAVAMHTAAADAQGMNDSEAVALLGAHAFGKMHGGRHLKPNSAHAAHC